MGARGHDGLAIPGRVVLARESAFSLGSLEVEPKLRQVRFDQQQLTLEPRIMQVLVALARAGGEIVTRDELVDCCWDRRIVGDDSINRAISRIRRLVESSGVPYKVETIPKIGYRLVPIDRRSVSPVEPWRRRLAMDRRAVLIGAGAAALSAGGVTLFLIRRPSTDPIPPEARLLYERAAAMNSAATPVTEGMVIPLLQEAVRIAPGFGDAWGALALQYRAEIERDPARRSEFKPRLREAVANARRYSPGNPDAEAATVLPGEHYGRWAAIEPVYRGLVTRHPNHAVAHHMLGILLMDVGRWSDAVEALGATQRLEPLSPIPAYQLTVALWGAGRITEAEKQIEAAVRRWPRHSAIWQTRIKLLALTGHPEIALQLLRDTSRLPLDNVGDFVDRMRLTATALLTGRADDARAVIALIERNGATVTDAIYCAAMREDVLALDMLEGMFFGSGRWARWRRRPVATHPLFQPHARSLWGEPRFARLLSAIRLEDYWQTSGTEPDYRRSG